ncbi:LysR family transcriptional regulator [Shewanella psychropiezotolerans]|uniref:LysR family transcriptional regulator n=1 Tax=Shewanella psychropiezotolerans TaxID=2593655 RepID=A0ABX5X1G8_9GAMM|nr:MULTISPECIES: LysR family transcriptional regulator [Shewanella]MPY21147.1 LysR family transcriptional regulator [Shewanella sp. YLB-07]MPY21934.1 LysR family transcriptional regulator [Shewanella sp. YLB-07]QDO85182.1 LysR family transcriptional regulator [Shewanella psychropiezotolerans]
MPSLDDINLFVQTVRHQGISSAAKANGLQRSKVSRRLQELEKQLGYQLLIRTTRNIELTERGQWLYEQVNGPLNRLNEAVNLMQTERMTPQGKMRLAIPPALGMTEIFSNVIEDYVNRYPDVRLEVEHQKQAIDLRRTDTDLQILPSYIDTLHHDYVQQHLLYLSFCMVASVSYLSQFGTPKQFSDLASHQLLASRYSRSLLPEDVEYHLYSDDLQLLIRLAKSGKGVALLPRLLVDKYLQDASLHEILDQQRFTELKLTLIYPSQPYLPEKTRAMVQLLRLSFGQNT